MMHAMKQKIVVFKKRYITLKNAFLKQRLNNETETWNKEYISTNYDVTILYFFFIRWGILSN